MGEKPKSYVQIGKIMNLSGSRVREIVLKSFRLFRHPTRRPLAQKIKHEQLRKSIFGEEC